MNRTKIYQQKVFYALLGIVAAVIPMPGNAFSSISIILLSVWWLFFTKPKLRELKGGFTLIFVLSIPFLLTLLGLIYTDDLNYGLKKLQLVLPFVIFPLIIFSSNLSNAVVRFVLYCFSLGTFLATLIGVLRASYFRLNDLGNYFYYQRFSELVDKHTTYLSLFVVISCLFVFHEMLQKRLKIIYGVLILMFFFFVLYVASTRISIVALLVGMSYVFFREIKSKLKWLVLIFPLVLAGFYSLPNFQKRFELNVTEKGAIDDVQFRSEHWQSVVETIEQNSILFGSGSGSKRDFLYDTYRKHKLTSAYELEYNAHNQYLEIVLDFGLIGLIAFLVMLIYLAWTFLKHNDSLAFGLFLVFCIFFLTESLLQRHDGVVVFSLFMSLFLLSQKKR